MRKKRGFTLIELMIVIAIIAILAAVLVPNFMRVRRTARFNACLSNVKNISTALESYSVDHGGQYPTSSTELQQLADEYVGKPMTCPQTKGPYDYYFNTSSVVYIIACYSAGSLGTSTVFWTADGRSVSLGSADQASYVSTIWGSAWGSSPTVTGSGHVMVGDTRFPAVHSKYGAGYYAQ